MFSKEVYVARRKELFRRLSGQSGIVVFLGNVEAPAQYKDNCYKWRQNSNWLYFFGIDEPRYAAVLDLDSGKETIFADDVDIDDIIWTGPMPSVASVAASAGVQNSAPYSKLDWVVSEAIVKGRRIHAVPPYRYYNTLKMQQLGIAEPSEDLIKAIVSMRLVKDDLEMIDVGKLDSLQAAEEFIRTP